MELRLFSKELNAEMILNSAKTGFNVKECFEIMTKKGNADIKIKYNSHKKKDKKGV